MYFRQALDRCTNNVDRVTRTNALGQNVLNTNRFEYSAHGPTGPLVHPVAQLEITDGELRLVDMEGQGIQGRLVQPVMLGEFRVHAFQGLEIQALPGVVEGFAKERVFEFPARSRPGREQARDGANDRTDGTVHHDYQSPTLTPEPPEPTSARVRPTSLGSTSLLNRNVSVAV